MRRLTAISDDYGPFVRSLLGASGILIKLASSLNRVGCPLLV